VHYRQQIPAHVQVIANIPDEMPVASVLGGLQVNRPCIVPKRRKCLADHAAAFTADQDAERVSHLV
jgi:hypothetical protein